MADLVKAIQLFQQAVNLTHKNHSDLSSRLSNLGVSYQCRFERTGKMTDLTEAFQNIQQAVRLTSENHPDMPAFLSNLGISVHSHFSRT